MKRYNLEIIENKDFLEFIPGTELTIEYAYKMRASLENTPINKIIINFKNSDYIDSMMVSIIFTTMKKGKDVLIKMRKGSYIEEVLTTYGFIKVVHIEYIA